MRILFALIYYILQYCTKSALLKKKDPFNRITSPDHIDPSRLLVTTVLDLTNKDVVRDAHTLLRSLRFFGGTINNATILVCIPAEGSGASILADDVENIQTFINSYGVEISFIPKVAREKPKTLLKFEAIAKFDSMRFDYLLWLDADTVIFRDPIPLLFMHPNPGMIQCVPELYSYMVRFPHINNTDLVRNRKLAQFRLFGAGETAPHGTCNTGVLFFDRQSLSRFLAVLPETKLDVDALNMYHGDRFMDSLYFVGAVNKAGIHVEPFPNNYQLNYMAFFEHEMMQSDMDYNAMPFIAHFIGETEMVCEMLGVVANEGEAEECTCNYINVRAPIDGLMHRTLETIMVDPDEGEKACRILAGKVPVINLLSTAQRQLHGRHLLRHEGIMMSTLDLPVSENAVPLACNFIQPPPSGSVQHILRPQSAIEMDLQLCCQDTDALATAGLNISARIDITLFHAAGGELSHLDELVSSKRASSGASIFAGVKAAWCFSWTASIQTSGSESDRDRRYDIHISPHISYLRQDAVVGEPTATLTATENMTVTIIVDSNTPRSQTALSTNYLLGTRSVSLSSQLSLSAMLNARRVVDQPGVAICCDTEKGQEAVRLLLREWEGKSMIVLLLSMPPGSLMSKQEFAYELNMLCRDEQQAQCIIIAQSDHSSSFALATAIPSAHLSFVYIDVYGGFLDYVASLEAWYHSLVLGGLMLGSRLAVTKGTEGASKYKTFIPAIPGVRMAVEAFSETLQRTPLVTYLDASGCGDGVEEEECLPAYYFFRQFL